MLFEHKHRKEDGIFPLGKLNALKGLQVTELESFDDEIERYDISLETDTMSINDALSVACKLGMLIENLTEQINEKVSI